MLNWTRNFFRSRGASLSRQSDVSARIGSDVWTGDLSRPPGAGDLLNGRYQLIDLVGRGATSVVYRSVDVLHAEEVAIKVLLHKDIDRTQGPADERATEAASALRLSHPNIARVFDLDRHGAWPFLVMEYLDGCDLHQHAKRSHGHRLPLQEILRIGTSLLDALSYAHSCGVVHNDVKPSNMLLTAGGTVKLCDFGLARLAEESPGAWLSMSSAGAPAFMSPERIKGDPSLPGSDLYGVGATLYTLAVGHTLFGTQMAQAWRGHLELEPPPSPWLPRPLFSVLRTALSKDPRARFESAAQMHAALIEAFGDMDDDEVIHEAKTEEVVARTPSRPPTRSEALRPPPLPTRSRFTPPPTPTPSWRPPMAPLRKAPPEGMVRIAETLLRSKHGGTHHVLAFYMQKTPVTNADWKRFLDDTGSMPPSQWLGGRCPPQRAQHPVVGVTLEDARRYAAWAGLRLPTDVEWEAAARGDDARAFPWGDYFDAARANGPERLRNDTMPVDANKSGASMAGCVDMVGNVWEWTEPDGSAHAPDAGYAWVFGGSFRHPCTQDGGIPRTAVARDKDYLYLGFRCARDDGRNE